MRKRESGKEKGKMLLRFRGFRHLLCCLTGSLFRAGSEVKPHIEKEEGKKERRKVSLLRKDENLRRKRKREDKGRWFRDGGWREICGCDIKRGPVLWCTT